MERGRGHCTTTDAWSNALIVLKKSMAGIPEKMLRVNGLMAVNAILAAILVGIGVYGPRYRYRAFIRILFLGATTLFLPILSYVASSATVIDTYFTADINDTHIFLRCSSNVHAMLTLYWACLVQIVGINTCALVAADNREGRNTGLPVATVVQVIWLSYLAVSTPTTIHIPHNFQNPEVSISISLFHKGHQYFLNRNLVFVFALIFIKVALRFYPFQKARHSFALGRNPRLIVGYMVQKERHYGRATVGHLPPRLIVMGEDRLETEKGAHGFYFKWMTNQGETATMMSHCHLVTIDKVWCLDDMLLTSVPQLKEVCFSFALFKLLRCRFAGYTVVETGLQEASNFFWQVLLKDSDYERVLGVITDELSFHHQYYYTPYSVSHSNCWLPILNILTSLLTIIYCIQFGTSLGLAMRSYETSPGQFGCWLFCGSEAGYREEYGNYLLDVVPVYILLVLVVLSEARDIASYVFFLTETMGEFPMASDFINIKKRVIYKERSCTTQGLYNILLPMFAPTGAK